jgi:hypothetical protein
VRPKFFVGTIFMSQNAFSMLAVIAALTFLTMALTACVSSEQTHRAQHDPYYKGNGVAEFHDARVGADSLRGELPSEN